MVGETAGTEGLAVASGELVPGAMVGEYRIESELGRGGMGLVYAAVHPVIAKRAAIKVLHASLAVSREVVDRFIQEARSVNQIGHANIVDIFSFGTLPDGRCFFAMEWLRGESLRERLRRSRLTLAEALPITAALTSALSAAHAVGIVHRDLKPDNVFLTEAGAVKLLDFGIAKLVGDGIGERTMTGNMLGTPAYMSPEQAHGQGVDHRTDIYALGAMLFEMLAGEMVFPARSGADVIAKHLYEPPRALHALAAHVPGELSALVSRMLAKTADERPTLAEIDAVLASVRVAPVPAPPVRSRRRGVIIASALLALGAGAAAFVLIDRSSDSSSTAARAPAPPPPSPPPPPAPAPAPAPAATPDPQPPAPTPAPKPAKKRTVRSTRPASGDAAPATTPTKPPVDDPDAPMR